MKYSKKPLRSSHSGTIQSSLHFWMDPNCMYDEWIEQEGKWKRK